MEETEQQFDGQLCRALAKSDTTFYGQDSVWCPFSDGDTLPKDALACVKDQESWSAFVPARPEDREGRFRVVCFRFAEDGPSAIGFVAWLHSHLRRMGKAGAIVICGKDRRGSKKLFEICQGIMDYWAYPAGPAGDRFLNVIRRLIEKGSSLN